jgi:hypothetical protein
VNSGLLDEHGDWDVRRVHKTFLPIDSDFILKIKPSKHGDEDVLAWQVEKSCIFSVKSAYKLALQSQPVQWDFPASSGLPGGENPCWTKIVSYSQLPQGTRK